MLRQATALALLVVRAGILAVLLSDSSTATLPLAGEKKSTPEPVTPPSFDAFYVTGTVNDTGEVTLRRMRRERVRRFGSAPRANSRFSVRAESSEGERLAQVGLRLRRMAYCSFGADPRLAIEAPPPSWDFWVVVPAATNARRVLILDGNREAARVEASSSPPQFLYLNSIAHQGQLELSWLIRDADDDDVWFDVYGDAIMDSFGAKGGWTIENFEKGIVELVASDGFWETRITRWVYRSPSGVVEVNPRDT